MVKINYVFTDRQIRTGKTALDTSSDKTMNDKIVFLPLLFLLLLEHIHCYNSTHRFMTFETGMYCFKDILCKRLKINSFDITNPSFYR